MTGPLRNRCVPLSVGHGGPGECGAGVLTGRKEARAHGDSVKFSHTHRTLAAGTNHRGREKVREK